MKNKDGFDKGFFNDSDVVKGSGQIFLYRLFCGFLFLIFLPISIIFLMNYSGFCWGDMRWLSDREKIDMAVNRFIASSEFYPGYFDGRLQEEVKRREMPDAYKSIDEFYLVNKNCCDIVPFLQRNPDERYEDWNASIPGFFDKACGRADSKIRVKYKFRFHRENGGVAMRTKIAYFVVDNCGKASKVSSH